MRQSATVRSLIATLLSAALAGMIALTGPVAPASAASGTDTSSLRAKAIYLQGKGDFDGRDAAVAALTKQSSFQGKVWREFVEDWAEVTAGMKMNTAVPSGLPTKNHVFILLGSALTSSGKASAKLERRLKLAAKALKAYPNSKILVSGGAPKKGKTEAAVMKSWLLANGVSSSRIISETTSTSTVGNARYSMEILAKLGGFSSYTIVTDSSHIRRASVLFMAGTVRVEEQNNKTWTIRPVANLVYPDLATAGQKALSASSAEYAASNVAGVFGLTSQYKAVASGTTTSVKLTSITVTKPSRLTYGIGDSLSTAGLVVKASYSNGSSRTVTGSAKLSGFSSAKIANGTVTVSYSEGGVTKTSRFSYKVGKASSTEKISLASSKAKLLKTKLAVKVKVSAGSVKPTGTVKLYLDGKLVRKVTLKKAAAGVAKFTFVFNKVGTRKFTATYSGDVNTNAAKGAAVKLRVSK